jgi:hypothetical protein
MVSPKASRIYLSLRGAAPRTISRRQRAAGTTPYFRPCTGLARLSSAPVNLDGMLVRVDNAVGDTLFRDGFDDQMR